MPSLYEIWWREPADYVWPRSRPSFGPCCAVSQLAKCCLLGNNKFSQYEFDVARALNVRSRWTARNMLLPVSLERVNEVGETNYWARLCKYIRFCWNWSLGGAGKQSVIYYLIDRQCFTENKILMVSAANCRRTQDSTRTPRVILYNSKLAFTAIVWTQRQFLASILTFTRSMKQFTVSFQTLCHFGNFHYSPWHRKQTPTVSSRRLRTAISCALTDTNSALGYVLL